MSLNREEGRVSCVWADRQTNSFIEKKLKNSIEAGILLGHMYASMEAGVFDMVYNLKLCRINKKCEMCDAVLEQIVQEPMRDQLIPPPKPNSCPRNPKRLRRFLSNSKLVSKKPKRL